MTVSELREAAIEAAELHAEWTQHRSVVKDSRLAAAVTPLLDEYLRGRAHVAAQRYEEATR